MHFFFFALLNDVLAFLESSLFLPQLNIYGTVNPFEEDSAKDLAENGQKCYA